MSKKPKSPRNTLANPTLLRPLDPADKDKNQQMLTVVIETPKGSRNKYAFDADKKVFILKKVLPAGMAFPYDFGFVPRTQGEDGDPLDVLVLMDEPAFPSCVLKCRPIGVIEGEQSDGKKIRNDRIIAVEKEAHSWADVKKLDDLGKKFCRELEEFFIGYHRLDKEKYRVIGVNGTEAVRKMIKGGMVQG